MKLLKLLGGVLAAATLFVAPALAGPPNALDAYVAKPEPSYNVRVAGSCKGEGYRCAVLQLTSQTWGPKDVDDRVWKHWMTVVIPDNVIHTKAFLYITGGDKGDAAPTKPADRFARLAVETRSVVVEL
uniref:PhoPQ-activated protein PqaA family protein n=1 Tax=Phenylobacterium sp. TaxID=1871053 RepID=UPI0037C90984